MGRSRAPETGEKIESKTCSNGAKTGANRYWREKSTKKSDKYKECAEGGRVRIGGAGASDTNKEGLRS